MASLASLLEQSQRLQQSHYRVENELPSINLGLDQIESQSRKIAAKSLKDTSSTTGGGNAAYILASGGVNADQLSSHINQLASPSVTFEPLLPLSDTDIEGYLKHTHEQTIISAIEEGRRATQADFYRRLEANSRNNWEKQKEKLFEELGRHQINTNETPAAKKHKGASKDFERGSPSTPQLGANSSLQMHSKMMRYDLVIRKLNQFRREGYAFGLVSALGEASVSPSSGGNSVDSKSTQTTETWRLLAHLVQERDVLQGEFQRKALQERCYASAYLGSSDSIEAVELRRMITDGGKTYLEEQFMNYVEKTLASRPAEANLGGIPSVQNKIRAFLNVKYLKNGNWSNSSLEIANNTPVWARIYYLLRSGHSKEALDFALENERSIEGLEKSFVAYFKAWLDSPDRRLPKLLRDRFLSEYNQRIRYTSSSSDPYKQALYKLLGRVELNRRNVAGVTQTTEDWLWFQLSLIREEESEGGQGGEGGFEKYGLRELANVLKKFGESHFDPKGNRPLLYFQVLLISGQFELAIAFLQQHPQYQADAVHFAIALEYYGLLRVPPRSKIADVELLVDASTSTPSLSFSRLIHRYTRSFVHTDALEALQYLYLICLNADLPGEQGKEQIELAHEFVRELVMETRQYSTLLGDVRNDGTKIPGQIEKDLKLLHLPDARTYLLSIVKSAALRADTEQRFSEAILLYNLAEEYDSVVSVLNLELSNSLSKPSTSYVNQTGGSLDGNKYFTQREGGTIGMTAAAQGGTGGQDVSEIAKSILEHYDRSSSMASRVGRKRRETCEVLMKLKQAMGLYEQTKLEQALQTIESTSLIPLSSDLVTIIRASEELKEVDDTIVRNLDIILLTTMTILYKLHQQLKDSPFGGDQSRQQKMIELRSKGRSLMMFAGMLRYRLTSETYSQLTRLDVFLH
ncbi:linker nucleoporin NIC96 [Sporobolomyces salmoneus]|uniref:linker nucleoporin NIC96 n=1 Tax=Sporobolomyces salmoneus TaxID=183962 RepID=UPI00317F533B